VAGAYSNSARCSVDLDKGKESADRFDSFKGTKEHLPISRGTKELLPIFPFPRLELEVRYITGTATANT
jgi:hypothetical protein